MNHSQSLQQLRRSAAALFLQTCKKHSLMNATASECAAWIPLQASLFDEGAASAARATAQRVADASVRRSLRAGPPASSFLSPCFKRRAGGRPPQLREGGRRKTLYLLSSGYPCPCRQLQQNPEKRRSATLRQAEKRFFNEQSRTAQRVLDDRSKYGKAAMAARNVIGLPVKFTAISTRLALWLAVKKPVIMRRHAGRQAISAGQ